jgi:hypothetical protein
VPNGLGRDIDLRQTKLDGFLLSQIKSPLDPCVMVHQLRQVISLATGPIADPSSRKSCMRLAIALAALLILLAGGGLLSHCRLNTLPNQVGPHSAAPAPAPAPAPAQVTGPRP